jgi:hypothetical protein
MSDTPIRPIEPQAAEPHHNEPYAAEPHHNEPQAANPRHHEPHAAEPHPIEETTMSATEEHPAYAEEEEEVFEDEEDAEDREQASFSRRPRRRLLTPLTALLFAILVGAGGFIAGVQVEKGEVPAGSASGGGGRLASLLGSAGGAGGSAASGRTGAAGTSGGSGEGGASGAGSRFGGSASAGGAGATVGQVANVSGSDLYVTELQGNTIKVAASAAQITKQVGTSVKGIHPGDTVVVQGTHLSDGSIQAATVRDSGSAGAGGGGIGALFGAGGGASGASGAGGTSSGTGGAGGSGGGAPSLFGR